ncbi:DinB family protein [Flavicella sp.]|uniref:DinB family protein n=1 Tax=Flavicella sp. TaxID=2957742 RepID=UPI0026203AB4|nr:DinB family protein [Flavicella sp.]MDG1805195.1 DinB family protein [Flavicella sp.]MDG2279324.1 DinB family protein [Flavicella sp.]
MEHIFDSLSKGRVLMLKLIDGLSMEQLNKTPEGSNNNIVWNIAHLVVTQQLLCYKLSGLPCLVSDEMIELYRKGTAPTKVVTKEEFDEIKSLFISLPLKFEEDYKKRIFQEYSAYTTSVNVTLEDIKSAATFNLFHEGIHLGAVLGLRKLV